MGLQNLDRMDKKNLKIINTDNNNVSTLQLHVMGNKDIDLIEGKQDVKSSTGMTPNAIFIYIFKNVLSKVNYFTKLLGDVHSGISTLSCPQ